MMVFGGIRIKGGGERIYKVVDSVPKRPVRPSLA